MTLAAIALGSNLGVREEHLAFAMRELARLPRTRVVARSTWIETDPVGGPPGQGRYLNGAALLETGLAPRELLDALLDIERRAGRARVQGLRDEPRTLDLDLLVHGSARVNERGLELPHPRLTRREFVLRPLAEIAPTLEIPGFGSAEGDSTVEHALRLLTNAPANRGARTAAS